MLKAIITTVLGALSIAAIFAAIKSRWLYVVAPKLYLNTPISDGQIVSIDIYNAGLTAEEDVAITFRQACKFELIGTSKSTLAVNGKTLSVPKLSRLESITVVLLIEGKAFDPIDIESVESKSTKGKVVESKEKATAIWQNFIALPILLLFLTIPFVFGTYVGAEADTSALGYINDKLEIFGKSKQLAGYKSSIRETSADNVFKNALKDSRVSIEVVEIVRRGEIITINTKIGNNMSEPLLIEAYLKTSAGDKGPLSFWDGRVESFALAPKESRIIKQRAFLPEGLSSKFVDNRISFETITGSSLGISHVMQFN